MPQEEVFSEQEATQIIRRAVELQERTANPPYIPGVSKNELEKVAQEIGVDPKFLRQALLESGEIESKPGIFHLTEEFERVIPGELDPQDFDKVAAAIKPFSNIGQPSVAQIGRTMRASAWTGISQATVEVTSREGRTRLKVKSLPFLAIFGALYPALIIAIVSAAALAERGLLSLGLGIAVAAIGCGFAACRRLLSAGHRASKRLADKLKIVIAEETATTDSKPADPDLAARINS
jgi:hypothetical protein